MLAIDKKKDVSVLLSIGATKQLIFKIFLAEGAMIAFTGALIGLVFGVGIVLIQEQFGLVGMGMQTSVESAYPVELLPNDVLITTLSIIIITFLASFRPASLASKTIISQNI